MTEKRLFLAGLAAGALGGILVGRLKTRPRWMPHLDTSQRALAETRGEVQGAFLAARIQARYGELMAGRPRFRQAALRRHLESSILPGLALYQALREEIDDQEAVIAEIDRHFSAWVEHSPQRKQVQLLARLPDPYAVLQTANRLVLKTNYPREGWTVEWLEDNDRCVAFDIRECFYLNVLTAYGAPELTAHFCQGDDLLYGNLPGISWQRTETLGRGDDRCNFRFCRADTPAAHARPASDALALYACPACKGKLETAENNLRCPPCQASYPLVGGIPDFLSEDLEQALGPRSRALMAAIVRLYETPLWYVPILKLAGGQGAPSYGEVIRQMVGLMDVREGLLLDVACGPGTWGRRLASPAMKVYGIDISWSMLRQGQRAAHARHSDPIHFARARAEALPFEDGQFDAAYCGGALHGFPDTIRALMEIGRTLKPGAPLVVLTFLNRDQPFARMRRRAEARNDQLLKLHMFEVPELEHALAQAGFECFEPSVYDGIIIFRARRAR
jgi:SAM-dependent methyltransferase